MKGFTSSCPYCGHYGNRIQARLDESSNKRDVVCDKCNKPYKLSMHVDTTVYAIKEHLESSIPHESIDIVKKVITKYLGYRGKGGYENRSNIELSNTFKEYFSEYDKAYIISFSGTERRYGNEYRTVRFYIKHNTVIPEVTSEFTWSQKNCFVGDSLEEKVETYIKRLLVQWKTI